MKNLKLILASAALIAVSAFNAGAQAVGFPEKVSAITNAAVFQVNGGSTTNLTAGQKRYIRLNGDGFALSVNCGSTNASTTTNVIVRIEFSVDGTNATTQFYPTFTFAPNGVGGTVASTNFSRDLCAGYDWARVYSIQNTNAVTGTATNLACFFTNIVLRVPRSR
jgi:hypothetical protein